MRRLFLVPLVLSIIAGGMSSVGSSWARLQQGPPVTLTPGAVGELSTHSVNVSVAIKTDPALPGGSYSAEIEGPGAPPSGVVKGSENGLLDDKGVGTVVFGLKRPPARAGRFRVKVTVGKAPMSSTATTTVTVRFPPPTDYIIVEGPLAGLVVGSDTDGTVYEDDNPGEDASGKISPDDAGVSRFSGKVGGDKTPAKGWRVIRRDQATKAFALVAALANTELRTYLYLKAKPPNTGSAWYEFSHGNLDLDASTDAIEALQKAGTLTKGQAEPMIKDLEEIKRLDEFSFRDLHLLGPGTRGETSPVGEDRTRLIDAVALRLYTTAELKRKILKTLLQLNRAVRCPQSTGGCPPRIFSYSFSGLHLTGTIDAGTPLDVSFSGKACGTNAATATWTITGNDNGSFTRTINFAQANPAQGVGRQQVVTGGTVTSTMFEDLTFSNGSPATATLSYREDGPDFTNIVVDAPSAPITATRVSTGASCNG